MRLRSEIAFDRTGLAEVSGGGLVFEAFDSSAARMPIPRFTAWPEGQRAKSIRVRPDQRHLPLALTAAFRDAVAHMAETGAYRKILGLYRSRHRMRGSARGRFDGPGHLRFLPWHRRYLAAFESELLKADRELRPGADEPLCLPYWRWPDPFPKWLVGFMPLPDPRSGRVPPPRRTSGPAKPTAADVAFILEGFRSQLKDEDVGEYVRFTFGLEGWGRREDGARLLASEHVRDWVGGLMSEGDRAPGDPAFFLHLAEMDRLWHIWQIAHPDADPPLDGKDRVLDPWVETYDDVVAVQDLGYTYESLVP